MTSARPQGALAEAIEEAGIDLIIAGEEAEASEREIA